MEQLQQRRLLTSRWRTAMAVCATVYVFALAVRSAMLLHTERWPIVLDLVPHGWPLTAVNLAFYACLSWGGFWLVRSTHGPERVVMVGWFIAILLTPVKVLLPEWAPSVRYIEIFGLAVSLLAALWLLVHSSANDSNERARAT